MIDDIKIKEILDYIGNRHRVVVRNPKSEVRGLLLTKGFDMKIMWEYAFRKDDQLSTFIPCICLKDGLVSYYSMNHLSKGKIRCEGCRVSLYKSRCELLQFEYLGYRSIKGNCLVKVKCKIDGNEFETSSGELLINNVGCETCFVNKYKSLAEKCGFEYITRGINKSKSHILIRCPDDGYFRTARSGELHKGTIKCRVCLVNKYQQKLSTRGCTYLDHYPKGGQVSVVYRTEDGLILESHSGNVSRCKFAITSDTHWKQKHSVYCITAKHMGLTYVKIGTANIPEQRMKDLQLLCETTVETIATFTDRHLAKNLESNLHKLCKDYRADKNTVGEFIGKQISRRRKEGNRVKVKDGITEWFNSDAIQVLRDNGYLNNLKD